MISRQVAAGTAALVASLMLVSCSSAPPSPANTIDEVLEQARAAGDQAAVETLSDLTVTRLEVDAARERMIKCLLDEGLRVVDHGPNPLDGWNHELDIYWDGMSDAQGDRVSIACQDLHYKRISHGYFLMNEDEIDPALLPDILQCVQDKGVSTPEDARSLRSLLPLAGEDPNLFAVTTCANSIAQDHGYTAFSIAI